MSEVRKDRSHGARLEPIIDWIGDIPIRHGEREDSEACLCGHSFFMACPDYAEGRDSLINLTLYPVSESSS